MNQSCSKFQFKKKMIYEDIYEDIFVGISIWFMYFSIGGIAYLE